MSNLGLSGGAMMESAKEAALDAVAGYRSLNPYTVGVAVEAAAAVLVQARLASNDGMGTWRARLHPMTPTATHQMGGPEGSRGSIEATAVDISERHRLLEVVAREARRQHEHATEASDCPLCWALEDLQAAGG